MKKEKKGKKRKFVIFIIIIITLIILGIIFFKRNTGTREFVSVDKPKIEDVVENISQQKQGEYEISNVSISNKGALIKFNGKIKNIGKTSSPNVIVSLYDQDNNFRGSNQIVIENLVNNEIKDFEIDIVGNYTDLKYYKITIEN